MPLVNERRKLAPCFAGREISTSRACHLLSICRRRLKYQVRADDPQLLKELMELAKEHPRFGVRRLTAMLRRRGQLREPQACGAALSQARTAAEAEAAAQASGDRSGHAVQGRVHEPRVVV